MYSQEPLIKIKPHVLKLLQPAFTPGEEIQIAIPCGNFSYDPNSTPRARDRDYLIITDKRLISVKGAWFENKQGLMSFPRDMVMGVDVNTFLLGCTVTVTLRPMSGAPRELEFPNCGKPEGEAVKKMFTEVEAGRRCTGCGRPLRMEFTFCPFCNTSLKRLCHHCGKALEEGWVNCPYCGR